VPQNQRQNPKRGVPICPEKCPGPVSFRKGSKGMATKRILGSKRSGIVAMSNTVVLVSRGRKPDARRKRSCKQSKGHFYRSSKLNPWKPRGGKAKRRFRFEGDPRNKLAKAQTYTSLGKGTAIVKSWPSFVIGKRMNPQSALSLLESVPMINGLCFWAKPVRAVIMVQLLSGRKPATRS
jgi:hypothetical protein